MMPVVVRLDVMIARRKRSSRERAARIGSTEADLSLPTRGHVTGVRFEMLAKLCRTLDCQPDDLPEFEQDGP